jgi:hypothetical protein
MSKPSKKSKNYLAFRQGFGIGDLEKAVAERDDMLSQYYVGHERYLARAINRDDSASVFIGPKGVGKSAVLQMVRLTETACGNGERIIEVRPDDLAFNALVNIKSRTPLLETPRQNGFLFKSLWDFVLCVAVLEKEHHDRRAIEQVLSSWFGGRHAKEQSRLLDAAMDEAGGKKSMTDKMLSLVKEIEVQGSFGGVSGGVRVATAEPKATDSGTGDLSLLQLINSVARELPNRLSHDYYILIDDLDLHWQGTPLQNAFLGSLFLSIRKFSYAKKIKFVVSLRKKIYRQVDFEERDKFSDLVCEVSWSAAFVREMLQKRFSHSLCVSEAEVWSQLFAGTDFETLYANTDGMPREVIRLAVSCVKMGIQNGHTYVTPDDVLKGMRSFSESRLDDLSSDQIYQLPSLRLITKQFAGGKREFNLEHVREVAFQVATKIDAATCPELEWAIAGVDTPLQFAKSLVRAGFLMVKAGRNAQAAVPDVEEIELIEPNNWYAVHPMYAAGLGLA